MGEDYALLAFSPNYHLNGIEELIYKTILRIQYQMVNWNVRFGGNCRSYLVPLIKHYLTSVIA